MSPISPLSHSANPRRPLWHWSFSSQARTAGVFFPMTFQAYSIAFLLSLPLLDFHFRILRRGVGGGFNTHTSVYTCTRKNKKQEIDWLNASMFMIIHHMYILSSFRRRVCVSCAVVCSSTCLPCSGSDKKTTGKSKRNTSEQIHPA